MTLIEKVKNSQSIWGYMYGHPTIKYFGGGEEPDKLIEIPVSKLQFYKDSTGFVYIWGWPGPDWTSYECKDYKKTWCFDPSEIPEALVTK